MIRFESQRVSQWYMKLALLLFCLQVILGLWLSINYAFTLPQALVDVFAFNTARAIHTNLLVAWMLLGFMGGTYFILPLECNRELYSTKIAWAQLIIFAAAAVTAVVGFLFRWTRGKPLLEIPFPLNALIVVAALLFIANVALTILKAKERSALQWMLLGGGGLSRLDVSLRDALLQEPEHRLLLLVVGDPSLGGGGVGGGDGLHRRLHHHGGDGGGAEGGRKVALRGDCAFSFHRHRRDRAPLLLDRGPRLLDLVGRRLQRSGAASHRPDGGGYLDAREDKEASHHQPPHLVLHRGASHLPSGGGRRLGVHAHASADQLLHPRQPDHRLSWALSLFGAYALLNLTIFYFAFPRLKNIRKYRDTAGQWGFWTMVVTMFLLGLAFGVAGILQTYLERFLDIGYSTAHITMMLWFRIAFVIGVVFLAGVLVTVWHLFTLKPVEIGEAE